MRLRAEDGMLVLALSRRNIESLLLMLDDESRPAAALLGRDNNVELLVIPEENDEHYRDRNPGQMSWES